ncbi:hypothetical protein IAQ61_005703 [Plenodomus lingam]|uniref:uncharacterized protein n=1 Tax=Leptosphaeria maculans TaxID=5022 RepID=UPI00331D131A|nr:hypothetical protein IAQ61_005703 [Plenodomus lingam]
MSGPYTTEPTTPLPNRRKRVRFTSSSDPSTNSDEPALVPTSTSTTCTFIDASELSEGDSDSSVLSSSSPEPSDDSSSDDDDDEEEEEENDDDDDEEADSDVGETNTEMDIDEKPTTTPSITNLRANRGPKPAFKLSAHEDFGPDIRDFLKDFLPRLKAANEELEAQKRAGTLTSLDKGPEDEGEPYIEMDLGLGVLEAKGSDISSDSEESSMEEAGEGGEKQKDKDLLGKLLGKQRKESVRIEVVPEDSTPK